MDETYRGTDRDGQEQNGGRVGSLRDAGQSEVQQRKSMNHSDF